jgi:type I restriction enzyme S subunit
LFISKDEPVVFSNHFLRLRVDETKIKPVYLAQWLVAQWRKGVFESMCTQWVNQAAVRKEDLLSLRLPIPPLTLQEQFAYVVAQVERLRVGQEEAKRQVEELAQSMLNDAFRGRT